jgi:hypothetical protein
MGPAMYYMLGCFGPLDRDRAMLGNVPEIEGLSWITGRRIDVPVPTPFEVDLDTSEGDALVPMFEMGVLMLTQEMIAALEGAGVDNLDTYDAIIHDRAQGIQHTGYKAVNIIGVVACADLGASRYEAFGRPVIDVDFDSLVIDEKRIRGPLMFRLAECVTGIVIHERVKQRLEQAGVPYLYYLTPQEWVG